MTAPISADEARRLRDAATPGPWTADVMGSEGYAIHGPPYEGRPGRRRVARCGDTDWEQDKANAALIAAAPSLAATVERLSAEVERLAALAGQHDPTGADHMEEMWVHAQRADAAEATVERLSEENKRLRAAVRAARFGVQALIRTPSVDFATDIDNLLAAALSDEEGE